MTFRNIKVEVAANIAILTVQRPEKLNALDNATIIELQNAVDGLSSDNDVGAVILTGAGEKAFIAGADIGMLADQGVLDGAANAHLGQALTVAIEQSPKPFLAAINGYALGGGLEMALACDVRYASSKASLGLPEVSLGIIPGYGGTQRLPRLIGPASALQLILTGDPVKADEALRLGIVQGVFAPEELMGEVQKVARKMLSRGAQAIATAKQAVRRGLQLPLTDGLLLEADLFGMISGTPEMKEGMAAFLEKRPPSWKR